MWCTKYYLPTPDQYMKYHGREKFVFQNKNVEFMSRYTYEWERE